MFPFELFFGKPLFTDSSHPNLPAFPSIVQNLSRPLFYDKRRRRGRWRQREELLEKSARRREGDLVIPVFFFVSPEGPAAACITNDAKEDVPEVVANGNVDNYYFYNGDCH